jgi:hypothetical protein
MLIVVNIPKTDSVPNKKKLFNLTMLSTAYITWSRWQITETRAWSNGGMIQRDRHGTDKVLGEKMSQCSCVQIIILSIQK